MNDTLPSTGARVWADHFNSIAEFHRHRKELDITDAERSAGEIGGFGRLVGTILLSTVVGVLLMGLVNVARTLSP